MVGKKGTLKGPMFLKEIHELRSKMSRMGDEELLKELHSAREKLPSKLRAPVLITAET